MWRAGADGDGGDEDGVTFGTLDVGTMASVTVVAAVPATAFLNAWIDLNQDSDFDDPGEQVFVDQKLTDGTNNLQVSISASATEGKTFARFRITETAGYSYVGLAANGEVEDYQITIPSAPAMSVLTEEDQSGLFGFADDYSAGRLYSDWLSDEATARPFSDSDNSRESGKRSNLAAKRRAESVVPNSSRTTVVDDDSLSVLDDLNTDLPVLD